MTAVFTPGYAAVEQFTAAEQGPWTDIYGLAATLHFAVTGQPPANAVDRVLDDAYVPLADGTRPFPQNLLAAIDAGLAVRAADRPQSIAAWRALLSQPASAAPEAPATVVMRAGAACRSGCVTAQGAGRSRAAMAFAAVAIAGAAAGGWFLFSPRSTTTPPPAPPAAASVAASPAPDRGQEELEKARREQKAALDEAAGLRAEAEARRKSDEEAALRRKIEDEMRRKAEAEEASRRQAAEEAARREPRPRRSDRPRKRPRARPPPKRPEPRRPTPRPPKPRRRRFISRRPTASACRSRSPRWALRPAARTACSGRARAR